MKGMKRLFSILIIVFFLGASIEVYGSNLKDWQSLFAEEIIRIFEDHFRMIGQTNRQRVEVKEVRFYDKAILPLDDISYELILPDQAYRGGNISFTSIFRVNGKTVKKARGAALVEIWAEVLTPKYYLPRYHEIQERDLQWVHRNISHLPPDLLTDIKDLLGKRTVISINPGEVIRSGMVEFPPLIRKGERVILLVENQQFKITALGEAKEDGRKGERVRLINLSSKKEVSGRVLDTNTVQIDF